MNFLSQILSQSPRVEKAILELQRKVGNYPLPVVLYGAGGFAVKIEKFLNACNLDVAAFFVSDTFINDPNIRIENVFTFSEILKMFPLFNVVIARGEIQSATDVILAKKHPQVAGIFSFVVDESCDFDFITLHESQFSEVYCLLEDDLSRQTLVNVLSARINADPIFLRDIVKKNQYFPEGIMQFSEEEIFVDGGAFNGDTFLAFLDVVKGKFARYYAFEPDPKNYKELSEKVCVDEKRVEIFLKGLWSVPALLNFSTGNGSASSLLLSEASDKGSFFQSIQVQVDTIDHLCSDATVIKMDIEGAELEALRGAMKTILRNYPKLAICVYHRPEHLFEIPLFIHSIAPEYHLYLRHHSEVETETVLYAIK